ncbi:unnamed protein product [marine sediment metagenome]|uniref:Uncharacterized protein n=1 Tax=marine sediment metagenome TaxID=412755 RepID=X0XBD8_9ZZZZ
MILILSPTVLDNITSPTATITRLSDEVTWGSSNSGLSPPICPVQERRKGKLITMRDTAIEMSRYFDFEDM